jgi:hypothetical protein
MISFVLFFLFGCVLPAVTHPAKDDSPHPRAIMGELELVEERVYGSRSMWGYTNRTPSDETDAAPQALVSVLRTERVRRDMEQPFDLAVGLAHKPTGPVGRDGIGTCIGNDITTLTAKLLFDGARERTEVHFYPFTDAWELCGETNDLVTAFIITGPAGSMKPVKLGSYQLTVQWPDGTKYAQSVDITHVVRR